MGPLSPPPRGGPHRPLVPRPVRPPTSRAPRAPGPLGVPAARGPVPHVEDGPGPSADRPPREAHPFLAGVRRPRDRPRRPDDGGDDAPPPLGSDPRADRGRPRESAIAGPAPRDPGHQPDHPHRVRDLRALRGDHPPRVLPRHPLARREDPHPFPRADFPDLPDRRVRRAGRGGAARPPAPRARTPLRRGPGHQHAPRPHLRGPVLVRHDGIGDARP